jgi:hypothetical protein
VPAAAAAPAAKPVTPWVQRDGKWLQQISALHVRTASAACS